MGVVGPRRLGRTLSRILSTGPGSQALAKFKQHCRFPWVPAGIPGSCSTCANLPIFSLDQDELELVLKGSYEDTQTSALGTASFRFHYMAAQEAELSGHLKVGLCFGALPALDQLQLLWAPLRPTPGSCGLASLPQLDAKPLARQGNHQEPQVGMGAVMPCQTV